MAQNVEAIDDATAPKPRKKKAKRPKRPQVQPRSWARTAFRSFLALAGLGLVMGVGAVLGRASARA